MFDPLRGAADLVKAAFRAEMGSPAGTFNWGWGVLTFTGFLAICALDGATALVRIFAPSTLEDFKPAYAQLIAIWIGYGIVCVAIIMVDSWFAGRYLGPPPARKHRK